jgi:hypothetical protein
MTTKTIDLVIARYNENLDWLKAYKNYNFNKIYLYNKGTSPIRLPDPFHAKAIYEDLENVGRCDHTYIHHIIKNYDRLGDVSFFIKGSTICPDRGAQREPEKFDAIIEKIFETGDSYFIGKDYEQNIGELMGNFTMSYYMAHCKQNVNSSTKVELFPANPRPFSEWYKKHFPGLTKETRGSFAGIFAVSKPHIQQRKKEDYMPILQDLAAHSNPEAGHFMERAWLALFYPIPPECFNGTTNLQGGKRKTYKKRRAKKGKRKICRSGCAK